MASIGSNGFQPVARTSSRPPTTPKLVQAVRQHVPAVGLEDERARTPAGAHEVAAQAALSSRGGEHDGGADAELLELEAGEPLLDGRGNDGDGRER